MSLGLKWLFPKESNFHLTPSEGAGLPLSQGTINRLVVQLGFEPSLRVSKTPVRPIHHWTFVKGFQSDHIGFQSCIHGLATSDIVPVLVAFSGKPIRTRQSSVLPMWLFLEGTFCTACLYRIEKLKVMCQGVEPGIVAILTYDSNVPPCSIHITN